jgi:PLP dependent protein
LIAVTKTYPASDVVHLAALGIGDVGENRDQEAAPKAASVAASGVTGVRWHYVGQLQRNKCRSVAGYANVVHSVDRLPLVAALATARAAVPASVPPLDVLVQVSLDGQTHRGGATRADVAAIAGAVTEASSLRLAGVMAVAPLGLAGDAVARAFAELRAVSVELRSTYPEATVISAGMSADLEPAIMHGATHVRVGSALLGTRPLLG